MNYRKAKADILAEMQMDLARLKQKYVVLNALDGVTTCDCGYDLYDQLITAHKNLESLESVLERMQKVNGEME